MGIATLSNLPSKKERGLLKGAIRRVFSRSELRRSVIDAAEIKGHTDPTRPRVTKWAKCANCKELHPKYLMQVDHKEPLVPIDKSLEEMTWDEVVSRTWCDVKNLDTLCKPCHRTKTLAEGKERRRLRKERSK